MATDRQEDFDMGWNRPMARIWAGASLALLLLAGLCSAQEAGGGPFPEREAFGVVETLEIDRSSLIINGLRFRVALDAHVRIDGRLAAYTLLRPEAKVHFIYRMLPDRTREIFTLQTVHRIPDDMIY
jgi:hypothetical protein